MVGLNFNVLTIWFKLGMFCILICASNMQYLVHMTIMEIVCSRVGGLDLMELIDLVRLS